MAAKRRKDGTYPKGTSGNPTGLSKAAVAEVERVIMDEQVLPGMTFRHLDAWVSQQTGIGDPNVDKRQSFTFKRPQLSYQQAVEIWSADDMARIAIEDPIDECFREGGELVIADEGSYSDLKTQVEEKMEALGVDHAIRRLKHLQRGVGGGAILNGADDGRPLDQPLNEDAITSLDWLTILEPIELQPVRYYQDWRHPKYGEPEFYEITAFQTYGQVTGYGIEEDRAPPPASGLIHESRLKVIGGRKVSRYDLHPNAAGSQWGDTILSSMIEVLRDYQVGWHSAGLIATDVSQPVISIKGLMQLVAKNAPALQARMRALEMSRSTARALLIDLETEKFERQTTVLSGVAELLQGLSQRFAASIGVPLSRLGAPTTGIGNDGTGDQRWYNNQTRGRQINEIRPLHHYYIRMIMRTLRKRKIPKRWCYEYRPLEAPTEDEAADSRLTQARTDSMYIKSGVLYPDEVRKSRFGGGYSYRTQIAEHKKAPGFAQPPPQGTPGSTHNPGGAGPGPAAHAVGGYTRRNPAQSGTEPAAKQGGDVAPREKKDADGPGIKVAFQNFPITIESPRGSTRTWYDASTGQTGSTDMRYDYGYVEGATGADGDCVDVYLGPDESAEWVYVVHQAKAPDFVMYDEDKAMLGFATANDAIDAYVAQYTDPRFLMGMSQISVETFRDKIFREAGRVTNADDIVEQGDEFIVKSSDGTKVLGRYPTRVAAEARRDG